MTVGELAEAQGLETRDSRKICKNTYLKVLERYLHGAPKVIGLLLHKTFIVTFEPDRIVLDTGGWWTVTTKDRINIGLQMVGLWPGLFSKNNQWYICKQGYIWDQENATEWTDRDRMILDWDGEVLTDSNGDEDND